MANKPFATKLSLDELKKCIDDGMTGQEIMDKFNVILWCVMVIYGRYHYHIVKKHVLIDNTCKFCID